MNISKVIPIQAIAIAVWLLCFSPLCQNCQSARTLRLWLVSSTPGGDVIPDQDELSCFNNRFGANSPVTVANTVDPFLCDQLLSRNPEYGEPDWQMVRSHRKLLDELVRFAEENRVRIVVRFLSWCRAFSHLDAARNPDVTDGRRGTAPKDAPDVAQIGDTWAAWFADKDALAAWPDVAAEGLKCRSLPGCGNISVRYIADLRMLFYWRRLPGTPPSGPWLEIDPAGWTQAVECILAANSRRSRPLPPVAFPLGLTPNLVHDYAPLVWAGGGAFMDHGTKRFELSGVDSIRIPLFLSRKAVVESFGGGPSRIFAFPEISHEECCYHFLRGRYLAAIEPVSFASRWFDDFAKQYPEQANSGAGFWGYADAVVTPGASWKGGSDLVVMKRTKNPGLAFRLAAFLSSDERCRELLAGSGFMPAQTDDFGVETLLEKLGPPGLGKDRFARSLSKAVENAREHAAMPEWPVLIESAEMLAAFQDLWRAVGQGDENGRADIAISAAASQIDLAVNRRIYWPTRIWYFLRQSAAYILLVLCLGVSAALYHYCKVAGKNRKIAAKNIEIAAQSAQLAKQNATIAEKNRLIYASAKILKKRDFVLISRMGELICDMDYDLDEEERALEESRSLFFCQNLGRIRKLNKELYDNIRSDLLSPEPRVEKVGRLIGSAWDMAFANHVIGNSTAVEEGIELAVDARLENATLGRLPYAFVFILQEIFYNSMALFEESDCERRIVVSPIESNGKNGVELRSPVAFDPDTAAPFAIGASGGESPTHGPGQSFLLIRDLCLHLFNEIPEYWWLSDQDERKIAPDRQTDFQRFRSLFLLWLPLNENGAAGAEARIAEKHRP